ncbi:MAG TPA: tetratricopeptide repeat protein [Xenococcaceae cyanobacterium]
MSDPDYTIPISQGEDSDLQPKVEYGYKTHNRGDIIGERYEIAQELGCGGFATTYLADDLASIRLQRDGNREPPQKCVIKQLQPRFNSPTIWQNAKERLDTEGNVLKSLGKHDRIPQFLDYFQESGQFYLVLEFIRGEEFEHEVQRQILNEAQVIDFLWDILEILNFVHQQGVIHRDIKPSNLIRRIEDRKMVLIDFGAVKEISSLMVGSESESANPHTQIIGTPGYMPPEQNHGNPVYSSDLYALGKTAIYGLTGKSPIELEEFETQEGITWQNTTHFSSKLIKVLKKMIAPKTTERYNSALEVLQDLRPLRQIGRVIQNRYYVEKFISGEERVNNYLVKDITQAKTIYYYLKKLTPLDNSPAGMSWTLQQIKLQIFQLAKLNQQEQIPQIVSYFIDEKNIYLLQTFIEGESIAQLIDSHPKVSEAAIVEMLLNTAQVLAVVHQQHLSHGNIQPASIWQRSSDRQIFLYDFAAIQNTVNRVNQQQNGYLPPEKMSATATLNSDIYGLGMTAIHWLTGILPRNLFSDASKTKTLWQEQLRVSPALVKVLQKMISWEGKKSYRSLNHLIKDLKKLQQPKSLIANYLTLVAIPVFLSLTGYVLLVQWGQRAAILEFYRGDLKLEAGQYQPAIKFYEEGLKKITKNRRQVRNFEQVWLKKAQALTKLKQHREALKTCTEALRHHQSYQLWNCQGLALDNLQQYQAAIAAYNQAIALAPEDLWWLWNNRGESYLELGQTQRAIADFEKAIQLDYPRSFIPWNNIGKLHYQQGNYQQAITAYEQSIQVKDDYLPALIGLGNTQKVLGNSALALEVYNQALQINSKSYEAWYSKGLVEEYLMQYQEALKAYQKALNLKPQWQPALDALKRVQSQMGMTENN